MRTLEDLQLFAEKQNRISELETEIVGIKQDLAKTDYKALKFAEGELSAEEYAPIREERRALRAEINTREAEIKELEKYTKGDKQLWLTN